MRLVGLSTILTAALLLGGGCAAVTPATLDDVHKAVNSVRTDGVAAAKAQETRYWEHLAKNPGDVQGATAAAFSANVQSQTTSAATAKKDQESYVPWWVQALIASGLLGAVGVWVKKKFGAYDAQPLESKTGEKVPEGDLVSMVLGLVRGKSPPVTT